MKQQQALLTVPYKKVVERRPKAIKLDLGEVEPAWFPLHRITLDENNYTVSAEQSLIAEKLNQSRGVPIKENDFNQQLIKLAPSSWESDKAIGIDVFISRLDRPIGSAKKRVFFSKSQLQEGKVPRWLVHKKEQELLTDFAKPPYTADHLSIRGLRARAGRKSKQQEAPQPQKSQLDLVKDN